ncbi:hypothetical protein PYW07_007135 [Mythimna separata]|uniref:Uncharacterized protein n=1 Tax=Mythimna separata TaxID=271217 RepID=A0AAD7Z1P5_MYTSE|nr:hypothetical protein PYW07_007135 [Mythimna separata]
MRKPILYLILFVTLARCAVLPSIPEHLRDCYRAGAAPLAAPRRLDVYLSLLRRVELHSQLDMRLLSSALLRSLRLDGVEQSSANAVETEFILPYRASSFQFHKYKILMDIFLPSQNLIQVDDILSVGEKCLLHRMLSSAVRQWERGDENLVCPLSAQLSQSSNNMQTQSTGRVISRCPIEDGVIQTNWGTVSPGTLVAAVAASLEYQRVAVTEILNANIFKEDIAEPIMVSAKQEWFEDIETLDPTLAAQRQSDVADIGNIWVATLAGDIAEVVVNQGPRVGAAPQSMVIGSNNRWNDTLLPRDHYLFPQNLTVADWHLTDAEILAGIDGLILAHHVPKWIEQRRSLRLSQVLDMYYSSEGVSFDPTVKACNRQNLFRDIVKQEDLLTETSRFAHVLSLRQITVYIPVEEMERITNAAITAFMEYAPIIMRRNHRACQVESNAPIIDLIVATDGSWKGYDVEQFMSWLGGSFETNLQRGSISLLHGNTGAWIAPPSYNLTTMFSHISNFTDEWPNRLNLPTVLSRVLQHSLNSSLVEIANNASAGPSTVVLLVSPTDRPSAPELERARELMTSLRTTYFDVYFAYVAEDVSDFQNINNEYLDYSELFVQTASRSVQDVIAAVDTHLVKSNIPQRLVGAQCAFNGTRFSQVEYEDFALPGRPVFYRMHPFYLRQQALIRVQFRNDGQGQLLVCAWRGAEASHSCQALAERALHVFNLTEPCPSPDFCPPAYFAVTATSTANLCANNDCRLPNQVGYYITHGGLRCLPLRGDAVKTEPYLKLLVVIVALLFIQIKLEN